MTDLERILIAVEKITAMMEEQVRVNEMIAKDTVRTTKLLASWDKEGVPQQTMEVK